MKWKTLVCILGVVLWCTTAVMAGSGPPTTDKAPASTAELTATYQMAEGVAAPALTSDELTARLPAAGGGQMSRQDVIWDNYPDGTGGYFMSSQLDPVYPFDSQVADDFLFDFDMIVTDVHWAGGYWNEPTGPYNTTAFHILFYADDGSGMSPTGGPLDPSGTALEHYVIDIDDVLVDPGGTGEWGYEVTLPYAFYPEAGVRYWIAIQSENVFQPQWGISDSDSHFLAWAVQGFPLLDLPYWTIMSEPAQDSAFRLTGECVEPGVCGNGVLECGEECDTPDDDACPDRCWPPGHEEECQCMPGIGACCIALNCEFDSDEFTCVDVYGGDWYPGESCEAVPPFECPIPPDGACCVWQEDPPQWLCLTSKEADCAGLGEWFMDELCPPEGDFVCPGDPCDPSLYYQPVQMSGWTAGTSDADVGYQRYDNFWGVSGTIIDLHWWGLVLECCWEECMERPMSFYIRFYQDDGGVPGAEVASYDVTLSGVNVGNVGYVLWRWDIWELVPPVDLPEGWVSIQGYGGDQDCWLLWMSSDVGDGISCFDDGTGVTCGVVDDSDFDLSFCLTGEYVPHYGACCNDCTASCNDDVEQMNCPLPLYFEEDTLCDDLYPPCGQGLGACCLTDGTCSYTMCGNCAGMWLGRGTSCDDCPCYVPCPPGGTDEGEPCGTDTNGGCNMDPPEQFRTIAIDETVCGTAWAEGGSRDTDWYEIVVTEPTELTFSGTAEFDFVLGYVEWNEGYEGSGFCTDITGYISPYVARAPCVEGSVTMNVNAGTHWFFFAPEYYEGMPCTSDYKDYWVLLEGPCEITCEGTAENEPDCPDEYEDVTNGGCNSEPPVFGAIACGETICGDAGTYTYTGQSYRDTDWYAIQIDEPKYLTMTVEAEFPVVFGFAEKVPPGSDDCADITGYIWPSVEADPCEEASVTSAWLPPGEYWCFVAPSVYTGYPMCTYDYRLELACDDAVGPIEDDFTLEILPDGTGVGQGSGCIAYWYIYDSGWINVWFYDHPFDPDRTKEIFISFDLALSDPGQAGLIAVALNYAIDTWSTEGNPPGEDRVPPLPPDADEAYIARPILVEETDDFVGHYEFTIVIEDYNPEWVSIDVMGYNFIITGIIIHECVEGDTCPWDHNDDGVVNPIDVNRCKDHYDCVFDFVNYTCPDPDGWDDPTCPEYDHTGDCVVNPLDTNRIKDNYGPCP